MALINNDKNPVISKDSYTLLGLDPLNYFILIGTCIVVGCIILSLIVFFVLKRRFRNNNANNRSSNLNFRSNTDIESAEVMKKLLDNNSDLNQVNSTDDLDLNLHEFTKNFNSDCGYRDNDSDFKSNNIKKINTLPNSPIKDDLLIKSEDKALSDESSPEPQDEYEEFIKMVCPQLSMYNISHNQQTQSPGIKIKPSISITEITSEDEELNDYKEESSSESDNVTKLEEDQKFNISKNESLSKVQTVDSSDKLNPFLNEMDEDDDGVNNDIYENNNSEKSVKRQAYSLEKWLPLNEDFIDKCSQATIDSDLDSSKETATPKTSLLSKKSSNNSSTTNSTTTDTSGNSSNKNTSDISTKEIDEMSNEMIFPETVADKLANIQNPSEKLDILTQELKSLPKFEDVLPDNELIPKAELSSKMIKNFENLQKDITKFLDKTANFNSYLESAVDPQVPSNELQVDNVAITNDNELLQNPENTSNHPLNIYSIDPIIRSAGDDIHQDEEQIMIEPSELDTNSESVTWPFHNSSEEQIHYDPISFQPMDINSTTTTSSTEPSSSTNRNLINLISEIGTATPTPGGINNFSIDTMKKLNEPKSTSFLSFINNDGQFNFSMPLNTINSLLDSPATKNESNSDEGKKSSTTPTTPVETPTPTPILGETEKPKSHFNENSNNLTDRKRQTENSNKSMPRGINVKRTVSLFESGTARVFNIKTTNSSKPN